VSCKQVPISTSFKQSISLLKATRIINQTFFLFLSILIVSLRGIGCIFTINRDYDM
jgi:hypothetical protein